MSYSISCKESELINKLNRVESDLESVRKIGAKYGSSLTLDEIVEKMKAEVELINEQLINEIKAKDLNSMPYPIVP